VLRQDPGVSPEVPELRLRPLCDDDEPTAVAAHAELVADDFEFLLDYDPRRPWGEHVRMHRRWRCGLGLPPDRVPAAFLLAHTGPRVVGRVSIRFELNEFLATQGGHVGYAVRPGFRRRGYAGEILRQALVVAEGVTRVLVTCDDDNPASAAVIVKNGGVEVEPWADGLGRRRRRFWID
jgi:predicted acetyltransferase